MNIATRRAALAAHSPLTAEEARDLLNGWRVRDDLATDPDTRRASAWLQAPTDYQRWVRIAGPQGWCSCDRAPECEHIKALRLLASRAPRARPYVVSDAERLLDRAVMYTRVVRRFPGGAEATCRTQRGLRQVRVAKNGWSCTCGDRDLDLVPCLHVRALRRLLLPPDRGRLWHRPNDPTPEREPEEPDPWVPVSVPLQQVAQRLGSGNHSTPDQPEE